MSDKKQDLPEALGEHISPARGHSTFLPFGDYSPCTSALCSPFSGPFPTAGIEGWSLESTPCEDGQLYGEYLMSIDVGVETIDMHVDDISLDPEAMIQGYCSGLVKVTGEEPVLAQFPVRKEVEV